MIYVISEQCTKPDMTKYGNNQKVALINDKDEEYLYELISAVECTLVDVLTSLIAEAWKAS